MDSKFNDIFTRPENEIFRVVFFPDRVYHARYLNATLSRRYRYNVREVRDTTGIMVMKGEVYLDSKFLCNFIRVEYKPNRLVELMREQNRLLGSRLKGWLKLWPVDGQKNPESNLTLHYCPWIDAYQVELWGTLEAPPGSRHDYKILQQMGRDCAITRVPGFSEVMGMSEESLQAVKRMQLKFREFDFDSACSGNRIADPQEDKNYLRTHQEPIDDKASSDKNTVKDENYLVDFQRGWFLDANTIKPVKYHNAMMDNGQNNPNPNPDWTPDENKNILEMRWIVQRELGSSLVFFHEVTIPPGTVEGTHRHIGTEELYYIVEGTGTAYMGAGDDPSLDHLPSIPRRIYGYNEDRPVKELKVKPGNVIYTKSGGIHGIRNDGDTPLKFVAFLYHTS